MNKRQLKKTKTKDSQVITHTVTVLHSSTSGSFDTYLGGDLVTAMRRDLIGRESGAGLITAVEPTVGGGGVLISFCVSDLEMIERLTHSWT